MPAGAETNENRLPEFSEADKARARQWFKKAADCRERREYDYAIECYITGLTFWPEAVEEGHMPLSSLALQRQQAGGRKPSMMESIRKPMVGKDARQAMLNAEYLWAKDPHNAGYMDGVLKNAARAGLHATLRWIAPKVMESLRRDAKPNLSRFKTYRTALVEAAERADAAGDAAMATFFYQQAVASVEYLTARNPGDAALRDEQRDLAGKLAIAKGKYAEAESFRDSLQDAEAQKLLHDADRIQQGEQTHEQLIAAARREYEADPTTPVKINAYVELLAKRERKDEEDEAIRVLTAAYQATRNYSFKARADDLRLRQLRRQVGALREQARSSGSEEDRQQLRLAEMELNETELEVFRDRVEKYPTDLRAKYRLGEALFKAGAYDEAIPVLQAGQADPRSRSRAQLLIGRAFLEKGAPNQAAEVLKDAIEAHEIPGDDVGKELMYWLGRSYESQGATDAARAAYGRLLRIDYNYRDARRRLEALGTR